MKNAPFAHTIAVRKDSLWGTASQPYIFKPTSFDGGDRVFRDGEGNFTPEASIVTGLRLRHREDTLALGPVIWHGIQITLPIPLDDLCWPPFSIGDVIVDEREPDFPIRHEIVSIEVQIKVDSDHLLYRFPDGMGYNHQFVCKLINGGQFRVIAGGGQ